ncbi:MAG: hypothetical protein JWQ19_3691 [Subtercola sp.]|nr:hypothetical protein [Subtercola sp.]
MTADDLKTINEHESKTEAANDETGLRLSCCPPPRSRWFNFFVTASEDAHRDDPRNHV